MTHQQHIDQRNAVRASLLLAPSRAERHAVYTRAALNRCTHCGFQGGLLLCDRCGHGKRAA